MQAKLHLRKMTFYPQYRMQERMELEEKLMARLREISDQRQIAAFAQKCGVSQANLSRALGVKAQQLGLDKGSKILSAMGALVIFPDEERYPVMRRMACHSPTENVTGDNLHEIPVFEEAGAGLPAEFFSTAPENMIPVLPQYNLPDVRAVKVTGDSMEPTILKGAYVGVIPLDDELEDGGIYLVQRPPFGLVVKRVMQDEDGNIILHSDNPRWKPQKVPNEGYDNIIIGKVVWTWQLV